MNMTKSILGKVIITFIFFLIAWNVKGQINHNAKEFFGSVISQDVNGLVKNRTMIGGQ